MKQSTARDAPYAERHFSGDRVRPVAIALIHVEPGMAQLLCHGLARPGGPTVIESMISVIRSSGWTQTVVVAMEEPGGPVRAECERLGVLCVDGDGDALSQLVLALRAANAGPDHVMIRVPGDCPLICPEVIHAAVETLLNGKHHFVSTNLGSGVLPVGLDVEVTYAGLLFELHACTDHKEDRTRGTWLIYRPPTPYRVHELSPQEIGPALERSGRYYASYRLTLRDMDDLHTLRTVSALMEKQQNPRCLTTFLRLLDQHPEWRVGQSRPSARFSNLVY